jgi:hypothetical protein
MYYLALAIVVFPAIVVVDIESVSLHIDVNVYTCCVTLRRAECQGFLQQPLLRHTLLLVRYGIRVGCPIEHVSQVSDSCAVPEASRVF